MTSRTIIGRLTGPWRTVSLESRKGVRIITPHFSVMLSSPVIDLTPGWRVADCWTERNFVIVFCFGVN